MATSRQQMQRTLRSAEEQNAVNARLIRSMLQRDKTAFQKALADGADPNAIGVVLSPGRKPGTNYPLYSAVFTGDIYFVTGLIAAGADVALKGDSEPPITLAISRGHHDMVEAMLQAKPGLIDSTGVNLVANAILSFSSLALIKGSTLTEAKRNALFAYYRGETTSVPGIETMELDYAGNIDVLRVLLKRHTSHRYLLKEFDLEGREGSANAWQLIHKPTDYIPEFLSPGTNPANTLRCLSEPGDPGPIVFEVQFRPLVKTTNPPWVKVCLDFSDLIEELRPIVTELSPNEALVRKYEALHKDMQLVHRQVERSSPYFQEIENLSPMQGRHYDALARHLAIMLQGYQTMSSGLMQRNKNTQMDCASTIMAFVAGHTPSPWGIPFGVVSAGLSIVAEKKERQRYARIANVLPADSRPVAQELAYKLTCLVNAKLTATSPQGSLDSLSSLQVEELAKRAFVVAIYVIHNLKDTDIDQGMSAAKKSEELIARVLVAVGCSDFMNELIAKQQCLTKGALIFSLPVNGTNGHGHSHNGGNGYHSPRNGQTEVDTIPAKGKRKQPPSPEKKCIIM